MKFTVSTLLSISVLAVSEVQAWGVLGHQAVALLAQNYLLPTTVTKVQEILNDNSADYMGKVATWADEYRMEPGGNWSTPFHFVDPLESIPPDNCAVHETDCSERGCVMSALANYTARVQDSTLDATEQYQALKFIIHLMGDISQPLHTEAFGGGANNLTVYYNGYKTNMHSVWDTLIPNSIMSIGPHDDAATMAVSRKFSEQLLKSVQPGGTYAQNVSSWISSWNINSPFTIEAITTAFAQESSDYVCQYALSDPNGPNSYNGEEVGDTYSQDAVPIVESSLAKAGVRLAAWLNLIFAGETGF